MNEDVLRWLCTALLKASGGEPVDLTDEELIEPFELSLKTIDGGLRVHVKVGDDSTPHANEVELQPAPHSPVPVAAGEDEG